MIKAIFSTCWQTRVHCVPTRMAVVTAWMIVLNIFGCSSLHTQQAKAFNCTIVVDAATGKRLHQSGECDTRVSPCSSFKFALAIMGFDSGILISPRAPIWHLKSEYNASNRDQAFKRVQPSAWLRDSVVWYSQELTRRLGEARFSNYVQKFRYGNQDISGNPGKHDGLTQAWLMSSLAISGAEQVDFLLRFFARDLEVSANAYERVRASMPEYKGPGGWRVHGKTGSGWLRDSTGNIDETRPQGWFVGWAERGNRRVVFARLEVGNAKSETYGGMKARAYMLSELATLASVQ